MLDDLDLPIRATLVPLEALARRRAPADPIRFSVWLVERRRQYGRVDYLARPVAGTGEIWVSGSSPRLTVDRVSEEIDTTRLSPGADATP